MSKLCRVLVVLLFAVPSFAQLVVTPSNLQGWQTQVTDSSALTVPPPAVFLAPGFETPPLGTGSVHLAVGPDGGDAAQFRHPGYGGTLLSNITALSYSTFVEVDGSGGQAPYLILQVDTDGDAGIEDLLFFEPLYQSAAFFPSNPQGPLTTDTWQTWDALAGGWYSVFGTAGSGPGVNVVPFSTLVAALPPGSTLANSSPSGLGAVRIVTGFGAGAWDDFLGAADDFTIGVSGVNTTYDFEPAAATVVTVTTATPDGWVFEVDDEAPAGTTATVNIVTGPGTPPLGDGSLELSVGSDGNDAAQARNNVYDGQFLRDLGQLTYSTYVQVPGSGGQAPYIMLNVDYNNDGAFDDILFFEPEYQQAAYSCANDQGPIVVGTWQSWDAAGGCWWSLFGTAGATPGAGVKPLSVILATEPDARLTTDSTGALRVVAGYGSGAWDNFVGNVDALTVSFLETTTTYDFEPVPVITIGDVTQFEGTGGTTNFVFNLTLSEAVSQTVTVDYSTADNTATAADGDYVPVVTGTATFLPNTTATTITITVNADNKHELDETFFVNLTNPQFAALDADTQGQGTIQNDDAQPTISFVSDVTMAEGNGGGTTTFPFNVALSNPSYLPITVNFTTNPGTATEGTDYADATGTLTFVPGDTAEVITVGVTADSDFENDETFTVDLSVPSNATITDPQALGTIQNDDPQPTIAFVSDVAQPETNGATNFVFTVTLSNASIQTVTVNYTTTPGTATEGVDYTDATGTLTFLPGDTSETITVPVIGDVNFETDETFTVDLSVPVNATIGDPQALGTIQNDDAVPVAIINDVAQTETNGATNFVFTVTLGTTSTSTVTINYTTTPGTATEGVDYNDATGTLTFVPGDTSEQITVVVNGENVFEGDETFFVDLSVPVGATISDPQGQGTIQNDDALPQAIITDVAQAEGTGGTTNFVFTVTLSNPSGSNATINYTTNPGTATEGVDYTDATGTITFLPGDVSETITVVVTADSSFEPDETFFVDLSAATGSTILDNQGLGTIQNDDGPMADLSITKVGPPSTPRDQNVTYTITVTNNGPDTASNVVVTDVLPAGTTFVSATPTQGTCAGTAPVICTLGAMNNGATATITLVVAPPNSGSFTNTATVANTPELDPTPANNAGTAFAFVNSNDIPTLSEWALMALISALLALAVFKLK